MRDLLPLSEHPHTPSEADDRSIEFHVAHSVQREVEVLHDQLLSWFADGTGPALRPRDVVVMVPDIDTFSAAIHAVFDQHKRSDPRFIPFEIGDVKDRSVNPLLVALEWLLRLPQQRCRQSEVRDLLDVPADGAHRPALPEQRRVPVELRRVRVLERVLVLALGQASAQPDGRRHLEKGPDSREFRELGAQVRDDLVGRALAL